MSLMVQRPLSPVNFASGVAPTESSVASTDSGSGGPGLDNDPEKSVQKLVEMLLKDVGLMQKLMSALQQMSQSEDSDDDAPGVDGDGAGSSAGAPGPVSQAADPAGTAGGGASPAAGAPAAAPLDGAQASASKAGPGQGSAKLSTNEGGVPQAAAIDGVDPASKKVVDVGGGSDKVYNVTNATDRDQSFKYSDREGRQGTITLKPGETGTFRGPSNAVGTRINSSSAGGAERSGTVIDEDGATIARGADPNAIQPATLKTQNNDVSKVDGDQDYGGKSVNETVTLSDGRKGGDGVEGNHAYAYSTDDANSMKLAGDSSLTANVVMSDKP